MTDKITVIVPVYNVEKYLEKCVKSILNQTYTDLEIILVNDGSTDKSGMICEDLSKIDNRIKVFHKENGGLSDARNYGVSKATSEYVGFIDSDDYIDEDMYEVLYRNLIENDADLSMCALYDVFPAKKVAQVEKPEKYIMNSEEAINMVMQAKILSVTAVNKLYKKSLFENLKFEVGKIAEDAFLMVKLIDKCDKIVATNLKKYYYIHRENSITTQKFSEKFLNVIEAYEQNYSIISEKYPNIIDVAEMRLCWAYFYVLDKLLIAENYEDDILEYKLINYLKKNKKTILFSKWFSKGRKIAFIMLCVNKNLYRRILIRNIKELKR